MNSTIKVWLGKIQQYKVIVSNFSYLSILQIFNLVLPIVTYPFLIKMLSGDTYGKIVFAQAIANYFSILVNFGFNITATREISVNRSDTKKIDEIVSSIFILKFLLFIISCLILLVSLIWLKFSWSEGCLYLLTMWICFYEFLFPLWYFQGVEKMKYITFLSLTSRLIFLVFIFIFIKSKDDYLKVPIIYGIGAFASCLLALNILRKWGVRFYFVKFRILKQYIKKSYLMALAYIANAFTTNFNIITVKYFFSYKDVAYFDLATKIINIGISFLDLISQAIYPRMSKIKSSSFLIKMIKLSTVFSLVIMLGVQVFSPLAVKILGNNQMYETTGLIKILAFVFPAYIIGALLGRNCLVVYGYDGIVLISMLFSAVVYVIFIFLLKLVLPLSSSIIAYAFVISFVFETLYRYIMCRRLGLLS